MANETEIVAVECVGGPLDGTYFAEAWELTVLGPDRLVYITDGFGYDYKRMADGRYHLTFTGPLPEDPYGK